MVQSVEINFHSVNVFPSMMGKKGVGDTLFLPILLPSAINTFTLLYIVRVMEFSASITCTYALRMIHTYASSTMSWHSVCGV